MKTFLQNHRLFGLGFLILLLLLVGLWEDKTRFSTTVQAAGEPLQWVQPKITGTAPAALVQHATARDGAFAPMKH